MQKPVSEMSGNEATIPEPLHESPPLPVPVDEQHNKKLDMIFEEVTEIRRTASNNNQYKHCQEMLDRIFKEVQESKRIASDAEQVLSAHVSSSRSEAKTVKSCPKCTGCEKLYRFDSCQQLAIVLACMAVGTVLTIAYLATRAGY